MYADERVDIFCKRRGCHIFGDALYWKKKKKWLKCLAFLISHNDIRQVFCISTVNLEIFARIIFFGNSVKRHLRRYKFTTRA